MTRQPTLDVSGYVGGSPLHLSGRVYWRDLDAFTQGYVSAAFVSAAAQPGRDGWRCVGRGFSDLDRETLDVMIEDCEAIRRTCPALDDTAQAGRFVWDLRRSGATTLGVFTLSLRDDGKIAHEVAQ